ncbi:MAG TPA: excalibur calcium-binding domain-containing protein [Chloroflexota bacterium]|nr:excalibur calcium-binding domain-containing protein [Chloroflexota bacterium]
MRAPVLPIARGALMLLLATTVPGLWPGEAGELFAADKNCRDFQTWQEAQAYFLASGSGDPNHLDANHNGIACESLPGSPTSSRSPTPTATVFATPSATPTSEPAATHTPSPTPRPLAPTATPRPPTAAGRVAQPDLEEATAATPEPSARPRATDPTIPAAPATPPTTAPISPPSPSSDAPSQPAEVVSATWLQVMDHTDAVSSDGDVVATLEPGDQVRFVRDEDGFALVVLPDESGVGWVVMDDRVRVDTR